MRQQRQPESQSNPHTSAPPPIASEEDERRQSCRDDRKHERMRNGAMGKERRPGNVQRESDHIDVGQDRTGCSNQAHAAGWRARVRPGGDGEANGGMREGRRHGYATRVLHKSHHIAIGPTIASARIGGET